jgi:cytochrome d ubiquinol oxidase subunit I
VTGLKAFPRDTWPTNLPLVFWAFRVMVGIGMLMILLGALSAWQRLRGNLYHARWLHRFAVAMGPSGLVAVTAGWIVTEAGRQPFTVYGMLRTADSVSPIAAPAGRRLARRFRGGLFRRLRRRHLVPLPPVLADAAPP